MSHVGVDLLFWYRSQTMSVLDDCNVIHVFVGRGECKRTMYLFPVLSIYMGCCEDYLTCDIAFNAVMPLSRASTRRRYSRIEGVTSW